VTQEETIRNLKVILNLRTRVNITLKKCLLKCVSKRLNAGKSISFLNTLFRREANFFLDLRPRHNYKKVEEVIDSFLQPPLKNVTFSDKLWLILYPSPQLEHMSNHVLRDFVTLLRFTNQRVIEVINFGDLQEAELLKIRDDIESLGYESLWSVSVLHAKSNFIKNLMRLGDLSGNKYKALCIVNDLWRTFDKKLAEEMSPLYNIFLHFDPFGVLEISEKISSKFKLFPINGSNQKLFYPEVKVEEIIFSGSINSAHRRCVLDYLVKKSKETDMRLKINAFDYQNQKNIPTMKHYASSLNSAAISLDLSRKSATHTLITGRSLESLASGCLLISDEPKEFGPLSLFFTPDKDYLLFNSLEELGEIIVGLKAGRLDKREIQKTGHFNFLKNFAQERLSRKLFEIVEGR